VHVAKAAHVVAKRAAKRQYERERDSRQDFATVIVRRMNVVRCMNPSQRGRAARALCDR
jgi:hypothetical protein